MRAVSIRQPWAWLIVNGHVGFANLDWPTSYRGEFLIRAGLKLVQREYRDTAAQLLDQLGIEVPHHTDEGRVPRGGIVGMAALTGMAMQHPSPAFRGPYAWLLAGARQLPFTPFKPAHSGPDLRWFDVPRAVLMAGLAMQASPDA